MIKKEVLIIILLLLTGMVSASELKVTQEHPFLINGKWMPASSLKVRDELTTLDNKKVVITSIKDISLKNQIQVYNLEANTFNNFVVKDGVVVHNSKKPDLQKKVKKELRDVEDLLGVYSDNPVIEQLKKNQEAWIGWSNEEEVIVRNVGENLDDYRLYVHSIEPEYFDLDAINGLADNPALSFSMIVPGKHSTAGQLNLILNIPPELIIFAYPKDVGSGAGRYSYSKIMTYEYLLDRLHHRYYNKGCVKSILRPPELIIEKTKCIALNELIATTDPYSRIRLEVKGILINRDFGETGFREGKFNINRILKIAKELNIPVIEISKRGEAKVIMQKATQ